MAKTISTRMQPLSGYIPEPAYVCNGILPRYEYADGKRTNKITGYVYTVTNTGTYDQIDVFVEQDQPLITTEDLDLLHESGQHFFVEFINAMVRPYYSEKAHAILDSIRAEDVRQVKTES